MKHILISASLVVCLGGCAMGPSPEEISAGDDSTCQSYGARPGTEAYTQCRMSRDQQRQQAKMALLGMYMANQNRQPPPQPYYMPVPNNRTVNTNCNTIGSTTNCQSY